jgi:hypothetical protein
MSMWGDMPSQHLVSPKEIYDMAKNVMLEGSDPKDKDDYSLIVNFIAANLLPEIALSACQLMGTMYEMPLTPDEIKKIVEFQLRDHN